MKYLGSTSGAVTNESEVARSQSRAVDVRGGRADIDTGTAAAAAPFAAVAVAAVALPES